jgi:hypothetical protein
LIKRKLLWSIAIPMLAAQLIAAQKTASPTLPKMSSAPLLDCSGLPCVDATFADGKHLRLGIDTGDIASVIDHAVAEKAGLSLAPYIGHDGQPVPQYQEATLAKVKIGDASLGDLKVLVTDLSGDIKRGTMPAVDGTIAYIAFTDRILRMDYAKHTIEISEPQTQQLSCELHKCGTITLLKFGQHGPPIVTSTDFTVNGKRITAQVDSMFTGTMLIYPTSVEKLGLTKESKSDIKKYIAFTDGGVDMFQATAATEGFGGRTLLNDAPLYFAGPKVHLPDGLFDATVGDALLRGHVATFDFHSMIFWLD